MSCQNCGADVPVERTATATSFEKGADYHPSAMWWVCGDCWSEVMARQKELIARQKERATPPTTVYEPGQPDDAGPLLIDPSTIDTPVVMRFFEYEHLPFELSEISRPFYKLAWWVAENIGPSNERLKCLDALLIAKDCAVRAGLPQRNQHHQGEEEE